MLLNEDPKELSIALKSKAEKMNEEGKPFPPKALLRNLIINAWSPFLFLYGQVKNRTDCQDKAIEWLEMTEAEENTITELFKKHNVRIQTALESQGILQLHKFWCTNLRCLECMVFTTSLTKASEPTAAEI